MSQGTGDGGTGVSTHSETFRGYSCPRLLRHLTSIEVRNFSPFPARDAITQRPTNTSQTHSSDDADIALARRRNRRLSSASVNTTRTIRPNSDEAVEPFTPRKRNSSKGSQRSTPGTPSTVARASQPSLNSTPSINRTKRRASVHFDSVGLPAPLGNDANTDDAPHYASPSQILTTQKDLEKIIWSRLVETFVTVELSREATSPETQPSHSRALSASNSHRESAVRRRVSVGGTASLGRAKTTKHASTSQSSISFSKSADSALVSRASQPSKPHMSITRGKTPDPATQLAAAAPEIPSPVYMSSFHCPSTNPKFFMNSKEGDFADWAELNSRKVVVKIWGRDGSQGLKGAEDVKGKAKAKLPSLDGSWRLIHSWDVDMSEMTLLSDDPVDLPANTLLLTMASPQETFYILSSFAASLLVPSRSETPEYNSDSEVINRSGLEAPALERKTNSWMKRERKTAGYQDLEKLVNLQTCIVDTVHSLRAIVQESDTALDKDRHASSRRDLSALQLQVQTFQQQRNYVKSECRTLQRLIQTRREQLLERQERLRAAKIIHEGDILLEFENGSLRADEAEKHQALLQRIPPIRKSIFSTLSLIFPIDLQHPSDLLFTILQVPLPIPSTARNPAPPLTLPSHPGVTEESVAAALGYAAQVVHLMAGYLNHRLAYPITYVGSRSVIKDPISSIVGPRVFPLYPKGVDSYRFEYAVFLLNKDVELLMAERNLRALDTRHTLANLKNLILTLSDSDTTTPPRKSNATDDTSSIISNQTSSIRTVSTTLVESTSVSEFSTTSITAPGTVDKSDSGTAKGSIMTSLARKQRAYLGIPPLSSIFWMRYPSSNGKPSVRSVEETPEVGRETDVETTPIRPAAELGLDDEDDRQTIRASDEATGKVPGENGLAPSVAQEKQTNGDAPSPPDGTISIQNVTSN